MPGALKLIINTKEFWDGFDGNYEETVISVFENRNELIKLLECMPNKNEKTIADFGCGVGNAVPYLLEFRKIYQIDFSENMLLKSKTRHECLENIEFLLGDNESTKLKEKVDVIIGINSVFPLRYEDFNIAIKNFIENTKENGEIILVMASFEFHTFRYHLDADYLFSKKENPMAVKNYLLGKQRSENYNPFGNVISPFKTIQKKWLKEEILFRLRGFNFSSVKIQKLKLTWNSRQYKNLDFTCYPRPWQWLVKIKK